MHMDNKHSERRRKFPKANNERIGKSRNSQVDLNCHFATIYLQREKRKIWEIEMVKHGTKGKDNPRATILLERGAFRINTSEKSTFKFIYQLLIHL